MTPGSQPEKREPPSGLPPDAEVDIPLGVPPDDEDAERELPGFPEEDVDTAG
jgi:hypothetical protein